MADYVSDTYSELKSISQHSFYFEKREIKIWKRHRLHSIIEFVVFVFTFTVSPLQMLMLVHRDSTSRTPNIVHFTILYIFVGIPMVCMETTMGKYSQLGPLYFSHLAPLGHGIGYTMLVVSIIKCIIYSILLGDFFLYFLSSMSSVLPWMKCGNDTTVKCWGYQQMVQCDKPPCLDETTMLSTFYFWSKDVMNDIDLYPDKFTVGYPIFRRAIIVCLVWLFIFVCSYYAALDTKKFLAACKIIVIIQFITFFVLAVLITVTNSSMIGVKLLFRVNVKSLYNKTAWFRASTYLLLMLKAGEIGYCMLGAYMNPEVSAELASVLTVTGNYIAVLVYSFLTYSSMGLTAQAAETTVENLPHLKTMFTEILFLYTPQAMCHVGLPQLWNLIYFAICFANELTAIVVIMYLVVAAITDAHMVAEYYKFYIVGFTCFLGCLSAIPLTSQNLYVVTETTNNSILINVKVIIIGLQMVMVSYIYGVQRFSDDIHFSSGYQPATYWKFCWTLIPILYSVLLVRTITSCITDNYILYDVKRPMLYYYNIIMMTLILLPVFVGAAYKLFCYIRMQNLIGLLRPEERWGPPDPDERHIRRMFNPREEIRSRRRNETCQHNCLLNSKVLQHITNQEENQRINAETLKNKNPTENEKSKGNLLEYDEDLDIENVHFEDDDLF